MSEHDLICGIGEVKVGRADQRLRATLGSCVGIGLLWREGSVCGLAHFLLPASGRGEPSLGARSVAEAIPSLLRLLKVPREFHGQLEAVVVGGASLLGTAEPSIGRLNTEAALRLLQEQGIRIVHQDVGGHFGRQIAIECEHYAYSVRRIEKSAA